MTFTDDLDNEVRVEQPKNVAVLSGSLADIWMLAGGSVACTTQDALDDEELKLSKETVNAGKLHNPNAEILISSGVDFAILTANIDGQKALADTLRNAGIAVASFSVETLDDYLRMLDICTDITGKKENYQENGTAVKEKAEGIIEKYKDYPEQSVLLVRVHSTAVKAKNSENNMTGMMLKELGCRNIADGDNSMLEDLSMEKIIEENPDYIFVTTMGEDEEAMKVLAENLQSHPAWESLKAVENGNFVVLPKDLFHNKPNDRWSESYEMLAEILFEK